MLFNQSYAEIQKKKRCGKSSFAFFTVSLGPFFRCRLLDKLLVTCPNADSCQEQLQRGNLDDHLRYRCSGTLVACQFAASGCDYRGPTKSMSKHQTECRFKKEGNEFSKTSPVLHIRSSLLCAKKCVMCREFS